MKKLNRIFLAAACVDFVVIAAIPLAAQPIRAIPSLQPVTPIACFGCGNGNGNGNIGVSNGNLNGNLNTGGGNGNGNGNGNGAVQTNGNLGFMNEQKERLRLGQ